MVGVAGSADGSSDVVPLGSSLVPEEGPLEGSLDGGAVPEEVSLGSSLGATGSGVLGVTGSGVDSTVGSGAAGSGAGLPAAGAGSSAGVVATSGVTGRTGSGLSLVTGSVGTTDGPGRVNSDSSDAEDLA